MQLVFKYSVLMAVPNRRRGERVNVGVVVFCDSEIDIRLPEIVKIKSITGKDWQNYSNKVLENLRRRYEISGSAMIAQIATNPDIDPAFSLSTVGMFSIFDGQDYESKIEEILASLVTTPKMVAKRRSNKRINVEVAKFLKKCGLLAIGDDGLESHKVFQNRFVEDGLSADFVQKNGVMRFATTLDLRNPTSALGQASIKAITLDRAKANFGSNSVCIGIYASNDNSDSNVRRQLNIMGSYASSMYNWQTPSDQEKLADFYRKAIPITDRII